MITAFRFRYRQLFAYNFPWKIISVYLSTSYEASVLADNVQLSGHTDSYAGWQRARKTVALNLAIDWSGGCNFSGTPITLRIRRTNFELIHKAEGEDKTNEEASTYRIRGVLYFPYDFGRARQSR
jgi:hypothetical protein